jgi:2-polyprenyl-3-methyl-5-hydroxy-6-metoxy-1,4-benzoquinol methylase
MNIDKAGKDFWDAGWSSQHNIKPINPNDLSRKNYVNVKLHEYFQGIFSKLQTEDMQLLEIGCACSQWLPYFAKEYGFIISGLDYSEIGCEQERQVLQQANITGNIVCANLFNPPDNLLEKFDIVLSLGVAEHFEDTSGYIRATAQYLKKGGILITLIPNITGVIGWIQKIINQKVYDIHVPLTASNLEQANTDSGIQVLVCEYFLSANFGMCNLTGIRTNNLTYLMIRLLVAILRRVSSLVHLIEGKIRTFNSNQRFATYVICVGTKK